MQSFLGMMQCPGLLVVKATDMIKTAEVKSGCFFNALEVPVYVFTIVSTLITVSFGVSPRVKKFVDSALVFILFGSTSIM